MRNLMKVSLITSSLMCYSGVSFALEAYTKTTKTLGETCLVTLESDDQVERAFVSLSRSYAGGNFWNVGRKINSTSISKEQVANCIGGGLTENDVKLVQDGADATSFNSESGLGFGFKISKTVGDYSANTFYEYKIGTSSYTEPADFLPPPEPTVLSVSSTTGNGFYKSSYEISIEVEFSEAVTVTGTPQLTLETGDTDQVATYKSGSGTDTLVFTYTVANGDTTDDLDYTGTDALALNGGTIQSSTQENADLTLATPGQANSLGAASAIIVDTTAPTVSLTTEATGVQTGKFKVTATFSERIIDFDLKDIVVQKGDASNLSGSGTTYTFDVTPTDDGKVIVSVLETVATDEAGNNNTGSSPLEVTADITSPRVILGTNAKSPHSGSFNVTVAFDEAVTGFVEDDVTVSYGTVSNFKADGTAGTNYTFDVTPEADGAVTIDVAEGVAQDAAGNTNAAASKLSITTDATLPSVSLTTTAKSRHSGVFSVTATFSEEVTDFELTDITVGNGTASNLSGSGKVYTFDVTPASDGEVTIDVAADVVVDATKTNKNTAATRLSVTTDSTAPVITITGPTDVVTEDFTVTFTFSEGVSDFTAEDVTVTNGTKGVFTETTRGQVYTLVVTPELGTSVSISVAADKAQDQAGNGNEASDVFEVLAGSPASEFEKYREEINQVVVDDAMRSLSSTLSANQNMVQQARSRFINDRRKLGSEKLGLALAFNSNGKESFDIDYTPVLNDAAIGAQGRFFGQTQSKGSKRRIIFGDFDVQRNRETDSTTATFTGRVAWEQMTNDRTMLGLFVGGELASSNINGEFEGDQDRFAVTLGWHAVHLLTGKVYLDGFFSLGAGRNDLEMANDVLALESDYTTRTATAGASVSGVYEYKKYEFRPELAINYGKSWIGDVGFTGRAYGLVDNTLSLDAGNVATANLTLRPQIIWALDAATVATSNSQLSFASRAICERTSTTVSTENCGTGAELGLNSTFNDKLSHAEFKVIVDRIGDSNRSSYRFNLNHRF
jgi:hypothetical protein